MIRKIEVLIADDNRLSRELLRAALEKYGVSFTDATTGREVLDLTAAKDYDVIFQDFMMPDFNGLELSRIIRERGAKSAHAFIVGVSASTDLNEATCREHGMNTYLNKPYNIAKLREIFERAVGYKGSFQENNLTR